MLRWFSAKLLAQEATLRAVNGRMDLAAQSVLDGLHIARSLEPEPVLISQLVRIAAEQTATAGLEQVLNRKGASETECESGHGLFAPVTQQVHTYR